MSAASHRISRLEPYLDRSEPAPTLLKMLVGVQLAGFREDAGLSQDQAARAVGFSGAKLSRIEAGKGLSEDEFWQAVEQRHREKEQNSDS